MLTIISNADDIKKCQQILEKNLEIICNEKTEALIGYQGGSDKVSFQYSATHDFWYRVDRLDNRYLNGFGLGKPNISGTSSLIVEINIPIENIIRRISGAFCRDEKGDIFLLHRGRIGGGRKGIGKNLFIKTIGLTDEVVDGNKLSNIAFITPLSSVQFADDLLRFIKKVDWIKKHGIAGYGNFEKNLRENGA